jgi:hypothetical protein
MVICWNCRGALFFGQLGWVHADPDRGCARLIVSWPPPEQDDEAEEA